MNLVEQAATFDHQRRPVEALEAYELAISAGLADQETCLNCVALYMVCCDLGFASEHRLPHSLTARAYDRALALLDRMSVAQTFSAPVTFWRSYIGWVVLGDQLDLTAMRGLISDNYREPVIALLSITQDATLVPAAVALLGEVQEGLTERQRYIRGVLESALFTVRHRRPL